MIEAIIVSIVFGSIVALATLICGTVIIINRTRAKQGNRGADSDEAQIVQEIYQGLERMEERIEALETILTDNKKRKNSNE